jgi:hypothetical protein
MLATSEIRSASEHFEYKLEISKDGGEYGE